MNDSTWLDGSDAAQSKPTPPSLYTKLKTQLNDALLTIDALDKASLAMLKHDTDYRRAIQRLLAPLTATPLSELVEEMMRSGLEAISSKMSALIPVPASISQIPAGPEPGPPSPSVVPVKKPPPPPPAALTRVPLISPCTTTSTARATRMQQLERLVKGVQVRSPKALQQVLDKSQGGLLLIWLCPQSGKWEEAFDTEGTVQEINDNITDELPLTPQGQPAVSPCIDAWMSADRARIVLFTHSSTSAVVVSAIRKIVPRLTSDTEGWLSIRLDQPASGFL